MEDVTESALDAVNSVEPIVAVVLIVIVWLRVAAVAKDSTHSHSET